MADRRNFKRAVRVEIAKRASVNGVPTCEWIESSEDRGFVGGIRCACIKGLDLHHKDQDALQVDKSRPLTANDGMLLCKPHHKIESAKQAPILAKVLAVEARHLGVRRPKQPFPKSAQTLRGPKRSHEDRQSLSPRRMYEKADT
jgi:hypothetical protein